MAYAPAYDKSSTGYDQVDYTRPHRDADIIKAMQSWMVSIQNMFTNAFSTISSTPIYLYLYSLLSLMPAGSLICAQSVCGLYAAAFRLRPRG